MTDAFCQCTRGDACNCGYVEPHTPASAPAVCICEPTQGGASRSPEEIAAEIVADYWWAQEAAWGDREKALRDITRGVRGAVAKALREAEERAYAQGYAERWDDKGECLPDMIEAAEARGAAKALRALAEWAFSRTEHECRWKPYGGFCVADEAERRADALMGEEEGPTR
jgi:hypothetical protein